MVDKTKAPRMKSDRRGAMLLTVAWLMLGLLTCLSIVVDFSRMYTQKNELHTAADAAALAGVIELFRDTALVDDSAISFGQKHTVLSDAFSVNAADVICGYWDDPADTFTASSGCDETDNAVQVTTRDSAGYMFPLLLSPGGKQLTNTSIAWMGYIVGTSCVKPWAMRYVVLTKLLQPSNPDTLRDLTEYDLERLRTLPRDSLRFMLKSGDPNEPGNFGSLEIPNDSVNGNPYEENIATCNNRMLEPGDTVQTEPGNMVGPTKQGADELCQPRTEGGECQDGNGNMGVKVISALWSTELPEVNGRRPIVIEQLVSFSLDTVTNSAEIIGHFIPTVAGGSVGSRPSTIRRPILVR